MHENQEKCAQPIFTNSPPAPPVDPKPESNTEDPGRELPPRNPSGGNNDTQREDISEGDEGVTPSRKGSRRAKKRLAIEGQDLLGKPQEGQSEDLRIFAIDVRGLRAAG